MIKINSEDLKSLMKQSHIHNAEQTIIQMINYYRSLDKDWATRDWYNFMTMFHPPLTLFLSINLLIDNPEMEYEINIKDNCSHEETEFDTCVSCGEKIIKYEN